MTIRKLPTGKSTTSRAATTASPRTAAPQHSFFLTPQERLKTQLRTLRLAQGQSIRQLAAALGTSKSYVSELELGDDPDPGFKHLVKLRDHFRVSMSELIGEGRRNDASASWKDQVMDRLDCVPRERLNVVLELLGIPPLRQPAETARSRKRGRSKASPARVA